MMSSIRRLWVRFSRSSRSCGTLGSDLVSALMKVEILDRGLIRLPRRDTLLLYYYRLRPPTAKGFTLGQIEIDPG